MLHLWQFIFLIKFQADQQQELLSMVGCSKGLGDIPQTHTLFPGLDLHFSFLSTPANQFHIYITGK